MFKAGDKVKALLTLTADDMTDAPIVPVGTIGEIIMRSEDSEDIKSGENGMKEPNCWVVDWGIIKYDTHESEMELTNE